MNIIPNDHMCYILYSPSTQRIYVGYTVNFPHRLRQHNGELVGGAKKTQKGRPWIPFCVIRGFYESSCALRFEYRLQHGKKKRGQNNIGFILVHLEWLIYNGDGSIAKNNKIPWPALYINWYNNTYGLRNVTNIYRAID